jgi:hypothetical protein
MGQMEMKCIFNIGKKILYKSRLLRGAMLFMDLLFKLKLHMHNKGIDAVNLGNIRRHKKVQSHISEYFNPNLLHAFPTHTLPPLYPNFFLSINKLCTSYI